MRKLRQIVVGTVIALSVISWLMASAQSDRRTILFTRLHDKRDGKLRTDELNDASQLRDILRAAHHDGHGVITLADAETALERQRGVRQAQTASAPRARKGGLFERVDVPGITNLVAGTNGFAIADLNKDGRLDVILAQSPVLRGGDNVRDATSLKVNALRVLVAVGPWRFQEHTLTLEVPTIAGGRAGSQAPQIPFLADFNHDGFLDIFLTRNAPAVAGRVRPGVVAQGCSLYVSRGGWDRFVDMAGRMGVRNETAYNRQASIGDINGDGWLDIAIGCDNIGNAMGGMPYSRLYVFRPGGDRFEEGKFEDIGGTDLVPDFGGFYHDSKRDKAGPDVTLRDLDDDGDLDLLQNFHVDIRSPLLPYSPGEYRQGTFCWRNLLKETGALRFEKVTGNGYASEGKLRYDRASKRYEVELGKAPGLPYVTTADVDNDGDTDILAVGPSDPSWSPRIEYVGGRFWRNLGGFRFKEATDAAGLGSLNWTYRQWLSFFGEQAPLALQFLRVSGVYEQTSGLPRIHPLDHRPYYADAVFGDFDNDGWQDLIVLDRREANRGVVAHAVFYHNKGDGTFEPKDMSFSGLDFTGIAAEAVDLDGDGLLDLIMAADPDNTGGSSDPDRYRSKVFRNTGAHGARGNHWLVVCFSGIPHPALIGAKVEVRDSKSDKLIAARWVHNDHAYKSSGPLFVHFGLGKNERVNIRVVLPAGREVRLREVVVNRRLELDLTKLQRQPVKTKGKP